MAHDQQSGAPDGPELWDEADIATPVQLLAPDGTRADHPVYGPIAADLTEDQLRGMYRSMVITRAVDATGTTLQRQGELSLWVPSLGQEGGQVGSATAIGQRDMIFPSYREHAVAHLRGLPMRELFPVMRGTTHGGWDPRAHGFHTYTFVLAAQMPHAAGYAMAVQRDGDVGTGDPDRDRAVVAYIGDGAMSEGDANETLIFAASAQTPLVVFCQNNQWAISVPVHTQSRVPIARRAGGVGMPAVRVDGNVPLASYAVTARALEHARAGRGPVFIEAVTYRLGAHTTSDDPTRYRTAEEEDSWRTRDPIDRMRTHLLGTGVLDQAFVDEVEAEARAESDDIRGYVRGLTPGPLSEVFDDVYVLPHQQVDTDRAAMATYQAGFLDADAGPGSATAKGAH